MKIKNRDQAAIAWLLTEGKALTKVEISTVLKKDPDLVETCLKSLLKSNQIIREDTGRHLYYRIPPEAISSIKKDLQDTFGEERKTLPERELPPFEYCRSCYGHLAGKVGMAVTKGMEDHGFFDLHEEKNRFYYTLTPKGRDFFHALDIYPENLKGRKRKFAKACLDWSERNHHLGGSLGQAFLEQAFENAWVKRIGDTRVIEPTKKGKAFFEKELSVLL